MKIRKAYNAMVFGLVITCTSGLVKSQSCGMFYPMVNGTEIEMTSYDTLNQAGGKSISKISDVTTTADGKMATVNMTNKNKDGVVTGTSSWSVKCNGTSVFVDMQSFVPVKSQNQLKDMTFKAEAGQLEIPQTLSVGLKLNDASVKVTTYKSNVLYSTMTIKIFNRVVAGIENITTPAGTFSCYKIMQEMTTEMSINGQIYPIDMKSAEYYASGTGLVKNEMFGKNGRLIRYGLLTKITKP
jgi:hypothetical protein